MVLLDKSEYQEKMYLLLNDTNTYKQLPNNPTIKYKNKLIKILREWVRENNSLRKLKERIYPTSQLTPRIYGTAKIHKPDFPLRPIVEGIGSITYPSAKYLGEILSPLVGYNTYHINNTYDFVEKIRNIKLNDSDTIVSFDVCALFTSIPTKDALDVIKHET